MKTYGALLRYHCGTYLKTNKYIMPLLAWFVVLCSNYMMIPVAVVSSFLITAVALCIVMAWLGLSYFESIDTVGEQILLLKVDKRERYYRSRHLFLISAGAILSFLGILVPVIMNIINGYEIFTRPLTPGDVMTAFVLHIVTALLGVGLASLFQPLCMKERKAAVLSLCIVCLLALLKEALIDSLALLKYVLWAVPPLSDMNRLFYQQEFFEPSRVLVFILCGIFYGIVYMAVSGWIVKKKLY